MSYTDCVSRISTLDSLIRKMDPAWATSGYSMTNIPGLVNAASPFSGVLQTVSADAAAAQTGATSGTTMTANASALGSSSILSGANAYSKFNVIGKQAVASTSTFESPLPSGRVSQYYGPSDVAVEPSATVDGVTYRHYHNGFDIAAPLGSPIRAAAAGKVTFAGRASDGAMIVKIKHDNGYTTLYGHLDPSVSVSAGDRVAQGQVIGKVGMTGITDGPHLHFMLYDTKNKTVDPAPWLKAGKMPDPTTLLGPNSSDPNQLTVESAAEVLARFDAVSSKIPYGAEIRQAAVSAGIDPFLLTGLVYAESNFHAAAVSSCGALGLTQLMPKTAKSLGVDPLDPQGNLNGGAQYIAKQMRNFGRVDLALAAYNAGPGAIGRLGVVPDSKKGYVRKILGKWSSSQELAA